MASVYYGHQRSIPVWHPDEKFVQENVDPGTRLERKDHNLFFRKGQVEHNWCRDNGNLPPSVETLM